MSKILDLLSADGNRAAIDQASSRLGHAFGDKRTRDDVLGMAARGLTR